MAACVFCARTEQPPVLFETDGLFAIPDRWPLLPGHVLIVSRAHLRCHAQLPAGREAELEQATERVRRFLADAYGSSALAWENGVYGQTVFHAHLHLIPVPMRRLPPGLDSQPPVRPIGGWAPVRRHFASSGGYHYLQLEEHRRLIAESGAAVRIVQEWLAAHTGAVLGPGGWIRATGDADVSELVRRWQRWEGTCSR